MSDALLAALRVWLGRLAPLLLLLALAGTAAGQYALSARGDGGAAAAALYAVGVVAFLLALVGARYLRPGAPVLVLPSGEPRLLLAGAFLVLLVLALATVELPVLTGLSLAAWGASLALAVAVAAVPPRGVDRAWARAQRDRLAARLRTREAAAVAGVVLVGGALRLVGLAEYPGGIHGDEGAFGSIAESILRGAGPHPFGAVFLDDPALFVYLEAPFLALLGSSITALRLLAGLSGTLTLLAFYLLLRRLFGLRPALLATLLLAGSAIHIHFSRLALNVPQVPLLGCLALLALAEGQATRRPAWWLAAGILGGLTVYFHFGGRLLAVSMALYVVYLLVVCRRDWRDWLAGAALGLAGALLAVAPLGVHLWSHPDLLTRHVGGRFIFTDWARVSAAQRTDSLVGVLLGQLKTNLLIFFAGADQSGFYPFGDMPMLAPAVGPLAALGLVLVLARLRDHRYALLGLWFWTVVVVGGALTQDSPQAHRLLPAVLPALAGTALVLELVVALSDRLLGLRGAQAAAALALAVPLVTGVADAGRYFSVAAASRPWEQPTAQATYVAALGPAYRVYTVGTPAIYFDHPVTHFLAPDVQGESLHNPATAPLAVAADRDLAFLVYPHLAPYLPLLQAAYPGGRLEVVPGRDGQPVFTALLVPRAEVARWQGLSARYPDGERVEADAGRLGGGASSYPASVTWSGSLYARQPGRYLLQADGATAEVRLDGVSLGARGEAELAAGWHAVEVGGRLERPDARVRLAWQPPGGSLEAVGARWLSAQSVAGALQARVGGDSRPGGVRRDRSVGFRNLQELLGRPPGATLSWEGTLLVPHAGSYGFTLSAAGAAQLQLEGRPVVTVAGPDAALRSASATVDLGAGPHRFAVRYEWREGPGAIEALWTPPGGTRSVIPPDVLGPSRP